jgi:hypothetical protein
MERERLTRLLEEPGQVAREDLVGLKDLARRYPWFSGAHLLQALGEEASGEVLQGDTLHTAAAHLPARNVLFDAVNALPATSQVPEVAIPPEALPVKVPPAPAPITSEPEALAAEATPAAAAEAEQPPVALPVKSLQVPAPITTEPEALPAEATAAAEVEHPPAALPLEDLQATGPIIAEPEAPSAEAPPAVAPTPEAAGTGVAEEVPLLPAAEEEVDAADAEAIKGPAPLDPLDNEIRRAAMASSYELLLEHAPERVVPVHAPSVVPEVVQETTQDKPAAHLVAEAAPPAHTMEAAPPTPVKGRRRFTDWLEATAPAATPVSAPAQAAAEKTPSVAPKETKAVPEAPAAVPKEKADPLIDTGSLIDRFIKQQTPPPPPKAEFFTPQQAGKRSLEDAGDMVTETLARIHAQQGNLAKAREAYRKLALKYPEKSAYFAALSEKLEGRSHN